MEARGTEIERLLQVGLPLVLHIEKNRTTSRRFPARILGWQRDGYLLLEVENDSERTLVFHPSTEATLQFMSQGASCTTEARLLDWRLPRQVGQIRVAWPARARMSKLRQFERLEVKLPCSIAMNTSSGARKTLPGMVCDLSEGGCGLCLPEPVQPKARLTASFTLPDGIAVEKLPVIACNCRHEAAGHRAGCRFTKDGASGKRAVQFYVQTTLVRLRHEEPSSPRILLIDPECDVAQRFAEHLEAAGNDVVLANDVVEGLFQLRLALPSVVLIRNDLPGAATTELCRLIRSAPGMQQLPLIIYGAGEEGSKAPGGESAGSCPGDGGATRYLNQLTPFEDAAAVVRAYLDAVPG